MRGGKRSAYRAFVGEPEENDDLEKIVISYIMGEVTVSGTVDNEYKSVWTEFM
jgi:hypothetical protein